MTNVLNPRPEICPSEGMPLGPKTYSFSHPRLDGELELESMWSEGPTRMFAFKYLSQAFPGQWDLMDLAELVTEWVCIAHCDGLSLWDCECPECTNLQADADEGVLDD